jgi:hypothetical protein
MNDWNQPMPPTQPTGPNDPPPGQGYRVGGPVLPPAPPPQKKSKKKWIIVGVVVAAVLLLFMVLFGACMAAISDSIDEASTDATIKKAAEVPATTEAPVVDNENPYDTPKVRDFKLPVKELSRNRFGSAGDNVEYRVGLVMRTSKKYDPDKSYELSYDVIGGEDGKERQTMMIRGDEYQPYEGYASTRSGVKITARPVSIEEV